MAREVLERPTKIGVISHGTTRQISSLEQIRITCSTLLIVLALHTQLTYDFEKFVSPPTQTHTKVPNGTGIVAKQNKARSFQNTRGGSLAAIRHHDGELDIK